MSSETREAVWLFGYGSLIYHVDFPYIDVRRASISGWRRRFWQGSHDHRGTETAPGRVVTLEPAGDEVCVGLAYQVSEEVFEHLDHREKNGYERCSLNICFEGDRLVGGISYIAHAGNFAFLGDAPMEQIARQIAVSVGPSGRNSDYLLRLAESLRELDTQDEHVFELEGLVRELIS